MEYDADRHSGPGNSQLTRLPAIPMRHDPSVQCHVKKRVEQGALAGSYWRQQLNLCLMQSLVGGADQQTDVPITNSPRPWNCPPPSGCISTEVVAIFISSMVVNRETEAGVSALPVLVATSLTVKLVATV